MDRALRLAARGRGTTSPNPMVGAVVVRAGRIVGEGFHVRAGEPHAEIHALRAAGDLARGADLYVTLEPCCFTGRTGPCTEAVIESGVRRVFVGTRDPNPRVAGRGVARLREAGIEVVEGVDEAACRSINVVFEHWVTTGLPYVVLKLATSLDGRIAAAGGASRWITGPESRRRVHALRSELDAVLVGSRTALADDPRLTVRDLEPPHRHPHRILVDGDLRVPLTAKLYDGEAPLLVATARTDDDADAGARRFAGAEVLSVPGPDGHVDLAALLSHLGGRSPKPLTSLLVEGGGQLAAAFLRARLVQRIHLFLAPSFLGADGVPALGALGVATPADAPRLRILSTDRRGDDLEVVCEPASAEEAS